MAPAFIKVNPLNGCLVFPAAVSPVISLSPLHQRFVEWALTFMDP